MEDGQAGDAIPAVSLHQFAVLNILRVDLEDGEGGYGDLVIPGKALRRVMELAHGWKQSGPSFYRFMARMEKDGLVKGEYVSELVDVKGQEYKVRARCYTITEKGAAVADGVRAFVAGRASAPGPDVAG